MLRRSPRSFQELVVASLVPRDRQAKLLLPEMPSDPRIGSAQRISNLVGEYFLFTLAAQLTTVPLILYYFRRLSLISLAANPLILPAQPPLMVLGGLATILGLVFLPLGRLFSYPGLAIPALHHSPGGALLGHIHPEYEAGAGQPASRAPVLRRLVRGHLVVFGIEGLAPGATG